MQFAIVDIETTGGYAAGNGITEIAVYVTDGSAVIDNFYAILNPEVPIPRFIESLTGITNEKVKDKPVFSSVAAELYSILKERIFVAHNVNFDYSFIRYHLDKHGFQLDNKKLCTIRLGRKVIPGLKGYGLDKICNHLKIQVENRHSASGDASATVEVFHQLIQKGGMQHIEQMLKSNSGEMSLPPNVSEKAINELPQCPGVYYFHEKGGKVIYVGKAKNIKKRVKSHFSNNKPNSQKQEFLKKIYHISYQETATELMALVLEGIEIKKRWPEQNKSQKHFEQLYGLYTYVDSKGYSRLFIEKKLRHIQPIYSFNYLTEGYSLLRRLIREYDLCPYFCFLIPQKEPCELDDFKCRGACSDEECANDYNKRVERCIEELTTQLPSFAVIDKGMRPGEKSYILIEKGKFVAMGYTDVQDAKEIRELKSSLTLYADNLYVRSVIYKYAEKHPYQTLSFSGISFSR